MADHGTSVAAAPAAPPAGSDRPLAGIAWMALGVSTLPLMDAIAKYLSAEYHVLQITWARYGFHLLLLIALLAWRLRPAELIPRHPGLQVLRSGFLLGTTLCYFGAISFLPLANVLAPVGYVEIIAAAAIGWLVFGDFPGGWTRTGVAVIVASGIYISIREGRGRARG